MPVRLHLLALCASSLVGCGVAGDPAPPNPDPQEPQLPPGLSQHQDNEASQKLDEAGAALKITRHIPIRIPESAEFLGAVTEKETDAVCYRISHDAVAQVFAELSADWFPVEMRGTYGERIDLSPDQRSSHRHFGIDIAHHLIELRYDSESQVLYYTANYWD